MEKKEIKLTEDALTEAMCKVANEITGKLPLKNVSAAANLVVLIGIVNAELVDILFGGGYRPQLMRRVAYDFAR